METKHCKQLILLRSFKHSKMIEHMPNMCELLVNLPALKSREKRERRRQTDRGKMIEKME